MLLPTLDESESVNAVDNGFNKSVVLLECFAGKKEAMCRAQINTDVLYIISKT
jgi:hypothetical protein